MFCWLGTELVSCFHLFLFCVVSTGSKSYRAIPGERKEEEKKRPQVVTKAQSEEQESQERPGEPVGPDERKEPGREGGSRLHGLRAAGGPPRQSSG